MQRIISFSRGKTRNNPKMGDSASQKKKPAMHDKKSKNTGLLLFLKTVQRDVPGSLHLTTPSLLQPPDPMSRYSLMPELQLQLSPEIEMRLRLMLGESLDPGMLTSALGQLDLTLPSTPAVTPGGAGGSTPLIPTTPAPTPEPIVPPGEGPETPRPGSGGDIWRAVSRVPAVRQLMGNLQTLTLDILQHDWESLSTGEQVGVASFGAVMAAGALGGVLSNPDTREQMLNLINGRVWPVPGVDFMNVELRFMGPDLMFGVHVDVGRLLPSSWGFGPSSPHALGGPPQPEPYVPGQRQVQRAAVEATTSGNGALAKNIENAAGRGDPLSPHLQQHLESAIDKRLPSINLHTDAQADDLAQSLQASAFTTGSDIFFRSGTYQPGSQEGLKLLAHEATHVAQQAAGAVTGVPTDGGVAVSEPGDVFEREADHLSDII